MRTSYRLIILVFLFCPGISAMALAEIKDEPAECYIDPLNCLQVDGDTLTLVTEGSACSSVLSMTTWFTGEKTENDTEVELAVEIPKHAGQYLTVTCPRVIMGGTGQTVLVVKTGCVEYQILTENPENVRPLPGDELIAGGLFFEISVMVRDGTELPFVEIAPARVQANPVHIELNGLTFLENMRPVFFSFPTSFVHMPGAGIGIEPENSGVWSRAAFVNVQAQGDTLQADAKALSLIAPYEVLEPVITLSPSPNQGLSMGTVEAGDYANGVVQVTNTGAGELMGTASVVDEQGNFSVQGAASYSLLANESALITIRYAPAEAGEHTASLVFSGAGIESITLPVHGSGTAAAIPPDKLETVAGCGNGGASKGRLSDFAVVIFTAMMLIFSSPSARSKRS